MSYSNPLQSFVVSLLLPIVFTVLFSRTGDVPSPLNSSTHRSPRFLPRNLSSLVTFAVFFLIFAATDTTFYLIKLLSVQNGQNQKSFRSICEHSTQDTSHLILHCPATDSLCCSLFGDSFSLLLVQTQGSCPAFLAQWSSTRPSEGVE